MRSTPVPSVQIRRLNPPASTSTLPGPSLTVYALVLRLHYVLALRDHWAWFRLDQFTLTPVNSAFPFAQSRSVLSAS